MHARKSIHFDNTGMAYRALKWLVWSAPAFAQESRPCSGRDMQNDDDVASRTYSPHLTSVCCGCGSVCVCVCVCMFVSACRIVCGSCAIYSCVTASGCVPSINIIKFNQNNAGETLINYARPHACICCCACMSSEYGTRSVFLILTLQAAAHVKFSNLRAT